MISLVFYCDGIVEDACPCKCDLFNLAVERAMKNGYKICGPAMERYINGKWNRDSVDG